MSKKKMPKKTKCDERYYAVRKEYFDIMHDASQAYDKIILGLSTAAIGFTSGLFLYKQLSNSWLMVVAGIFFILAISCSLRSLWLRQDFAVKGVKHLNTEYDNNNTNCEPFNDRVIKDMEKMQKWSGIFFVVALAFMIFYIIANLVCK